jgi:hypothetical protein
MEDLQSSALPLGYGRRMLVLASVVEADILNHAVGTGKDFAEMRLKSWLRHVHHIDDEILLRPIRKLHDLTIKKGTAVKTSVNGLNSNHNLLLFFLRFFRGGLEGFGGSGLGWQSSHL